MKYSFARKENRDLKAKDKKAAGFRVRKTCIRNQLCDPRYMEDWDESMGVDHETYFKSIYILEVD